jgi:hypothetical protein
MQIVCFIEQGQGEPTPSWPRGKNPEIGNLSFFKNFDFKFGFKSILLAQMTLNF